MPTTSDAPPNPLGIPLPHFQHIRATLAVVDERLDEMERRVSGDLPKGPLYRWETDFRAETRAEILHQIECLRKEIASIVEVCGMDPHTQTASRSVRVGALASLIDLDDLEPKGMRGFGAIPSELQARLQALWTGLRPPLEAIVRLCGEHRPEPDSATRPPVVDSPDDAG